MIGKHLFKQSLGKIIKYLPPNTKKYNYSSAKKLRIVSHKLEVYIAVNIMPMSGMRHPMMEASYAISKNLIKPPFSMPAPGLS